MPDPAFFQILPDNTLIPSTPSRLVALSHSRTPQKPRLRLPSKPPFTAHAYMAVIFNLRGKYSFYLYLLSAEPGSNLRVLLSSSPPGASISEYPTHELTARQWLDNAGLSLDPIDLNDPTPHLKSILSLLPFSPALSLSPEPDELPPLLPPKSPPLLQQLIGSQSPDTLSERLRHFLLHL